MNDQNIFLGNSSGKYWRKRYFVMIVNSTMLTMKTDKMAAATWPSKNKMFFVSLPPNISPSKYLSKFIE